MEWSKKFGRDFVARTFALIAPVRPDLHRVSCNNEMVPNARIRCFRCKKFQHDFVARTFALIAPVRPDLHRVSHSNEMFPNAPKHYEMLQNMSLGCNGMDQVHLLRKISTRLRCTNFCINCTSSARFATSFLQ